MRGHVCPQCFAGTLVDVLGQTVCTHCRRITTAKPPEPKPTTAELLAFASGHPTASGAIRRELGISPTRYYQLLNRAIDTDEAESIDPGLVLDLRLKRRDLARRRVGAA